MRRMPLTLRTRRMRPTSHTARTWLIPSHTDHSPLSDQTPPAAATASLPVDDDLVMLDEDAIALEDDGQAAPPAGAHDPAHPASAGAAHPAAPAPKKITFSADSYGKQRTWKRKHTSTGTGACR
jgi:hypothetical protein